MNQPKRRVASRRRMTSIQGGRRSAMLTQNMANISNITIDIDTFFQIEDNDLRKYVYAKGLITCNNNIRKIDNEEKIGYYYIERSIKKNTSHVFYNHSMLHQWIVYNKKTKKVKISHSNSIVLQAMLKDYMSSDSALFLRYFVRKYTPTLCKKIIEGKIVTVADLIAYNKSYVIKKKNVPLQSIYKFMICKKEMMLGVIEDPENLQDIGQLDTLVSVCNTITYCGAFTYKLEDIDNIENKYNEWSNKQDKKLNMFLRTRDGNVGNTDVEESSK